MLKSVNIQDPNAEIRIPTLPPHYEDEDEGYLTQVITQFLDLHRCPELANQRAGEKVINNIAERCYDCWDYVTGDVSSDNQPLAPYFCLTVKDLEWAINQVWPGGDFKV